jgi:signal transduction histidine kinase
MTEIVRMSSPEHIGRAAVWREGGIGRSAEVAGASLFVSSAAVNVDRAARPLGALLRLLLAAVIVTALVVDSWWTRGGYSRPPELVAIAAVAVIGVVWALQPRVAPHCAAAAASASLVATVMQHDAYYPSAVFTEFVVLPVLFGAVLAARRPGSWALAAYTAVAAEVTALRGAVTQIRWVVALAMLVLLGAAVTAVVYVRLRDSERTMSIELARQAERLALARELHDVVGHHVTGIVVLAQAKRFTGGQSADDDDGTLAEIEEAGLETLMSIRRLVGMLRADASTTTAPQFAEIEQVVDDLRGTHPLAELHVGADLRARWVPAELATTVQRLVQEVATNIRRHGDSRHPARIELLRDGTGITLTAANIPVPGARGNGYGLVGMRERVEALGGTFAAGLDGSGSWVVSCRLPLAATVTL